MPETKANDSSSLPDALDFTQCEREVLDRTGLIQAGGAVLILEYPSLMPIACSANWNSLTQTPVHSFGEAFDLEQLLAPGQTGTTWGPEAQEARRSREDRGSQLTIRQIDDRLILEWRLLSGTPIEQSPLAGSDKTSINFYEAAQRLADELRDSLQLDRVMIYKFDKDNAGDVIAEARRSDWEPYLGLHYPATDIPQIARDLYLRVRLRSIYDATLAAIPLITAQGVDPFGLDLTPCSLRSVSPYHLEYLRNMGVRATVSVAIVVQNRLWGLIACHHGSPLGLSLNAQHLLLRQAEALAQVISDVRQEEQQSITGALEQTESALRYLLAEQPHLSDAQILEHLLLGPYSLTALTKSHAAVVYANGQLVGAGNHPDISWVEAFIDDFLLARPDGAFSSEHLAADYPHLPENFGWSGLQALAISREPNIVLMVFRQPFLKEVHWGGDPDTPAIRNDQGRLSPRRSFHLWKETVVDHSRPWLPLEEQSFERVGRLLADIFAPAELCGRVMRGSRDLNLQMIEHAYIARAATSGGQHGLTMTTIESRDRPATLLQLNQNLLDLFELTAARWAPGEEVKPFLTRLGLLEAHQELENIPEQLTIWSPVMGHRNLKVSRQSLLSVENHDTRHAVVSLQLSDITGESRLLDALRSAIERAESASEAKTRFLANTSHELKTPLHAILGFQGLLNQELQGDANLAELRLYSQHIELASRHMLNLVEQLLFFTRSSRGGLRLPVTPLNLNTLIQESLAWQSYAAAQKQLRLEASLPEPELSGDFNAQTLQQLLINLITNAIKFSQPGSQILCSLSRDELSDACEISVTDQGIGMTPHEQQHAFEPFFQGEPFGTKADGSGIGLSLVKAIVEAHSGRIGLRSERGKGTCVTVWLPLHQRSHEIEILAEAPRP